ncbi:MAG: CdvA-like protein [Candidatus Bathyarchaeota archaeon]|nr:CdvA-like protein [Candidatus Bathyarchaeota archaeon]
MSNESNLFLSIGKPIKDEYGRAVGRVASFALTPSGKFDSVFIEYNDGKFSKVPMEYLQFNGAEVTFLSTVKSQASVLCDQIPLIWRKDQALKDLAEKRKISPDLYQELHNNFDSILSQLKKDAQTLIDTTAKEIARCDQEIKTLGYAVVNLELEHEIGQIDDEAYKSAFNMLQENLKRVHKEKSDLELVKSKLSNILLGDSKQIEPKPTATHTEPPAKKPATNEATIVTTELPEPPVVVYVKEVGKAGI